MQAISPNCYRVTQRERFQQPRDDQKMLMLLPKEVISERTWMDIFQKEDVEMMCYEIREDILLEAMTIACDSYMKRQEVLFTVHCAAEAWIKLLDIHFIRHDPGEDTTAWPPSNIRFRDRSWAEDPEPVPSPRDTMSVCHIKITRQELQLPYEVHEEKPEALGFPEIQSLPKRCGFPGKVALNLPASLSKTDVSQQRSCWPDEPQSVASTSSVVVAAESEVIQNVTDYSTIDEHTSSSGDVPESTVASSPMLVVGDATSGVFRHRHKNKGIDTKYKSKDIFASKAMIRSSLLPQKSTSYKSMISDCNVRALRMMLDVEVHSECNESIESLQNPGLKTTAKRPIKSRKTLPAMRRH